MLYLYWMWIFETCCCCSVSKSRPMLLRPHILHHGFPGGSDGEESACSVGDPGLIPRSGRSPGEGTGNPLQYSCLVNSRDRGAWTALVHGVAEESDMTERLNNNIWHLYLIFGVAVVKSLSHVRLFCNPMDQGVGWNVSGFVFHVDIQLFQ